MPVFVCCIQDLFLLINSQEFQTTIMKMWPGAMCAYAKLEKE